MRESVGGLQAALAAVVAATLLFASPLTAAAHVNRLVGPYTFFIVLIEEPFFTTNRAGFEFWVHDGARPVLGLDKTLGAQAINSTRHVDLVVSPMNARGFYDVEFDTNGQPFDPGSGGNWTLHLFGSVEGIAVDEPFATTFPAYPRVAAAPASSTVEAPPAGQTPWPITIVLGAVVVLGLAALAVWQRRRTAPGITTRLVAEGGFEPPTKGL
jgi:MYXO-CTERM domain-containing protein